MENSPFDAKLQKYIAGGGTLQGVHCSWWEGAEDYVKSCTQGTVNGLYWQWGKQKYRSAQIPNQPYTL